MDTQRLTAELMTDIQRVAQERRREMRVAVAAVLRDDGYDAVSEALLDRIIDGLLRVVYNETP